MEQQSLEVPSSILPILKTGELDWKGLYQMEISEPGLVALARNESEYCMGDGRAFRSVKIGFNFVQSLLNESEQDPSTCPVKTMGDVVELVTVFRENNPKPETVKHVLDQGNEVDQVGPIIVASRELGISIDNFCKLVQLYGGDVDYASYQVETMVETIVDALPSGINKHNVRHAVVNKLIANLRSGLIFDDGQAIKFEDEEASN